MNKLSEKGSFISKSEAVMLQAVAVMLMVWHHLFAFPERITVPHLLILDRFGRIETIMAYFGRICIAVFAFSSGYGMRKKIVNARRNTGLIRNYQTVLMQLLKFFSRYWMVFFVFVPLGILLKVYPFQPIDLLEGSLGNGCQYNEEWWYVDTYVRFLLLFPIMSLIADWILKRVPVLLHVLMAAAVVTSLFLPLSVPKYSFFGILLCFAEGMYCVDSGLFEWLYRPFAKNNWLRLVTGIGLFGLVFALRLIAVPDYVLVAGLIFSVMLICKTEFLIRWLRPVLMFVGKYSTYIWLTHTFFAYYLFQKITYAPYYSWLIFLWCMALCIGYGMVLEALLTLITKGFHQLFVRKK